MLLWSFVWPIRVCFASRLQVGCWVHLSSFCWLLSLSTIVMPCQGTFGVVFICFELCWTFRFVLTITTTVVIVCVFVAQTNAISFWFFVFVLTITITIVIVCVFVAQRNAISLRRVVNEIVTMTITIVIVCNFVAQTKRYFITKCSLMALSSLASCLQTLFEHRSNDL